MAKHGMITVNARNNLAREKIKNIINALPDPIFYQVKYFYTHGRVCDFSRPKKFSEKILHRMRFPQPIFSIIADKIEVRCYIDKAVGKKYLVPALLVCDKVHVDIFDRLPESFVMKANHSAGQVRIVTQKSCEDLGELSALANSWLESDFSKTAKENHYKKIKPKIIFEQALLSNGQPPADYKFNVFNPKDGSAPYIFIQHIQDRLGETTQDLYLEDWSPAPFARRGQRSSGERVSRPAELDEMLLVAKKVSEPFGYLRVDFYLHEGRIYIGELTLTPAGGNYTFAPSEWDEVLGEKFGWPEAIVSN